MRCMSAAQVKRKNAALNPRQTPREGTQLRKVYDLFYTNKGNPVEFQFHTFKDSCIIEKLVSFYGLDIRRIKNGNSRVGRSSQWVLAGEWFGKVYIDYIAERLHAAERPQ
jgi:hypothetical protein